MIRKKNITDREINLAINNGYESSIDTKITSAPNKFSKNITTKIYGLEFKPYYVNTLSVDCSEGVKIQRTASQQ